VHQPAFVVVCLATALAVWLFGSSNSRETILLWLDALGMAAYAVVGAAKAESMGVPPVTALVMGVLTATFGGVVRDVLAGESSVLLRREVYVSAAVLGAAVFVGLTALGLPRLACGLIGFAAALSLRGCAIVWRWTLPGFADHRREAGA
jgi:uncharacterized membrane protein YeiH